MKKYFQALLNGRMLVVLLLGFSSGLPYLLTGQTLKAWATQSNLDLTTIGFISLFGLPYSYKVLFAPFVDRFVPPFLGRRRGWMLISQIGLILTIFLMSTLDPAADFRLLTVVGFSVAALSALQDVVIDAYRREYLKEEEFGFGMSLAIMGYRLAMMFASAFALILAKDVPWPVIYKIMACAMSVGLLTTLFAPEPKVEFAPPRTLKESFIGPLAEFFQRKEAYWILAFILFYKLGDQMASSMLMPFYLKMGYQTDQIGYVAKGYGLAAVVAGGLLGGAILYRIGLYRSLWLFGFLQAISTLGFAILASLEVSILNLGAVITFENLTAGMGTAAYTTFMASMSNKRYTATQYALFTSLMGLPSNLFGWLAGWIAEHYGWQTLFVICTIAAAPGMLLLLKMIKLSRQASGGEQEAAAIKA